MADLYRPAASSIIGDVLPSSQRASGFAALRLAINLGFAFGMSLGGFLADWNWRLLFFGDGLTTLAFAAVVYLFIGETRPAAAPRRRGRAAPARARGATCVFLQLMAVSFAFAMVFFNHISTLPLTITGSAGYPASVFGGLVAVNGLVDRAVRDGDGRAAAAVPAAARGRDRHPPGRPRLRPHRHGAATGAGS